MFGLSKEKIGYFGCLIGVIFYANFVTNSFTFEPAYSLYPDSVSLYYLLYSFLDPNALCGDLLAIQIKKAFFFLPFLPFFIIYRILTTMFSFVVTVKILSISICILTVTLVYKIGEFLFGKEYAYFFSGLFLIYFLSMDSFYGGQMRSFGILIFCIFFLLLVKKKFIALPFFLPVTLLFCYHYLIILFSIACVMILIFYRRSLALRKYVLLLIINSVVSLAIGFLMLLNSRYINTNLPMVGSYKYYQNVNVPIDVHNIRNIFLYFILNLNEHSIIYVYFTWLFIIVSFIFIIFRKKDAFCLCEPIWIILLASVFSFLSIFPIHPFLASRQLVFSVPMFLLLFITTNMIKIRMRFNLSLTLFIIFTFILLHPHFNDVVDYKKYRPVYELIKTLPKGFVMGGNPESELMESIPIFSGKPIFFIDEMYDMWVSVYSLEDVQARRRNLLRALYADSLDQVKDFIKKYRIDYFIIEANFYTESYLNRLKYSILPFEREISDLVGSGKHKTRFPLLEFSKQNHDFKIDLKEGEVFIVDSRKIK